MKIFFVLFTFQIVLFSCFPKKNPKVSIENLSNYTIDSIKVFTSSNLPTVFYSLKTKNKVEGNILFDRTKKGDGCYKIRIYKKDSLVYGKCFGYYTNGSSLNYSFDIKIEPDTLVIKSK